VLSDAVAIIILLSVITAIVSIVIWMWRDGP